MTGVWGVAGAVLTGLTPRSIIGAMPGVTSVLLSPLAEQVDAERAIPYLTFAVLLFAFTLVSRRVERTPFTGPMLFALAGILIAVLEPDETRYAIDDHGILLVAEIGLAVVLFTDSTRIRAGELFKGWRLPTRLLTTGMLLTIAAGAIAGAVVLPGVSFWEAAVLGAILAPTDAGLGAAVVRNKRVPERIREALSVEAGLNDGLAVPFMMLFIGLAASGEEIIDEPWPLYAVEQIGIAVLVGAVLGAAGGWLIGQSSRRRWITAAYRDLALLSVAVVCYFAADGGGGSGFIAAFVAGAAVRAGYGEAGSHGAELSEDWGQLLAWFVFFVFGLVVVDIWDEFTLSMFAYAALSLTVIRMLPVAIALAGTGLHRTTVLFMGWFGPRGLASVVLGLVFLEKEANLAGTEEITTTIALTVLLSIIAHGVTAAPGIHLYARAVRGLPPDAPELQAPGGIQEQASTAG